MTASFFFALPGPLFWEYLAGVTLFLIFLAVILNNDASRLQGLDKLAVLGPLFLGFPLIMFGIQHYIFADFVAILVPAWIPWHHFWVYFTGTALIAAGTSLLLKKSLRLSATLLGLMFFLFVVLIHVALIRSTHSRFAISTGFRDLAFCGGAWCLAGGQSQSWRLSGRNGLITVGRIFIGTALVYFGVQHFLHPGFIPGIPIDKAAPAWLPLHALLAYLCGTVLLATGFGIALNKLVREAAGVAGATILGLILVVYLPTLIGNPADIGSALDNALINLMLSGSTLILATTQIADRR
jgi:uncharacterized membrane protein